MNLEILIGAAIAIYFIAWAIGAIESILFCRYMRRRFPDLAREYFPGVLGTSISQQNRTSGWLRRREYAAEGDAGLTARADLHRKVSKVTLGVVVLGLIAITGNILWSNF